MNMTLGEVARLDIASEYGYGADGVGDHIPPDSDLVFELQLVDIEIDQEDEGEWEDSEADAASAAAVVEAQRQQRLLEEKQKLRIEKVAQAKAEREAAAAATAKVVAQVARAKAAKAKAEREAAETISKTKYVLHEDEESENEHSTETNDDASADEEASVQETFKRKKFADDADFGTIVDEYIRQQTNEKGEGPPSEYRDQIMKIFNNNNEDAQVRINNIHVWFRYLFNVLHICINMDMKREV